MNLSIKNLPASFFHYPKVFTNSVKLINNNGVLGYEHIGIYSTLRIVMKEKNDYPNLSGLIYLSDIKGNNIHDIYKGITVCKQTTKYHQINIPINSTKIEFIARDLQDNIHVLGGEDVLIDIYNQKLRLISGNTTLDSVNSNVLEWTDYPSYAVINLHVFKRIINRFNPEDNLTMYLTENKVLIFEYECSEYSLIWRVY